MDLQPKKERGGDHHIPNSTDIPCAMMVASTTHGGVGTFLGSEEGKAGETKQNYVIQNRITGWGKRERENDKLKKTKTFCATQRHLIRTGEPSEKQVEPRAA